MDGIVGQTGELLGHNLFSYCKNNPINMHDDGGFRPDFSDGTGHETDSELAASLACTSSVNMYNYERNEAVESIGTSSLAAAADMALAKSFFDNIRRTKNFVEPTEEFGLGFELETTVARSWATPVKFLESKLGILAIGATLLSLYSDYKNNNGWDIAKSMAVDVVGFAAGVIAGGFITALRLTFALAVIAMGVIGLGIGALNYVGKKELGVN